MMNRMVHGPHGHTGALMFKYTIKWHCKEMQEPAFALKGFKDYY
jgi:hypothetical protein